MEWISVGNELPKEGEVVWVFRRGREEPDGFDDEIILLVYDGHNTFRTMEFGGEHYCNEVCAADVKVLTHWKPLDGIKRPI